MWTCFRLQPAVPHPENPVCTGGQLGVVRHDHDGLPEAVAQREEQAVDLLLGGGIKIARGLIGGKGNREARARAQELLETVGLAQRFQHKPSELSGGEQQRVAIARALVNNPAILFADEPTGNLDSRTKEEIHRLFFDVRKQLNQTIVIVTHDAGLAQICDRTCTLQDGVWV